jgi:hypothetical protein
MGNRQCDHNVAMFRHSWKKIIPDLNTIRDDFLSFFLSNL